MAVIARHIFGPGIKAIIGAGLVVGGAVVDMALGARGLVHQGLHAAIRMAARKNPPPIGPRSRRVIGPAITARKGRLHHAARMARHGLVERIGCSIQRCQHLLRIVALCLQMLM